MFWEIIKILNGTWELAIKSIEPIIYTLSAFWWVIVWWLISFLTSRFIFKKQKEHDIIKIRIEKSLEIIGLISKIQRWIIILIDTKYTLWVSEWADIYHKYDTNYFLDLLDDLNVLHYFVFGEEIYLEDVTKKLINYKPQIDDVILLPMDVIDKIDDELDKIKNSIKDILQIK